MIIIKKQLLSFMNFEKLQCSRKSYLFIHLITFTTAEKQAVVGVAQFCTIVHATLARLSATHL